MLLVEQRGDDGIQAYRLALAGSTSHEEVGRLGKVEGEHFVHDRLAKRNGQFVLRLLEGARRDAVAHRHSLRVIVGHLNADGRLAGNRGDDADTRLRGNRHGNLVAQVLHTADLGAALQYYLKERDRRAYGGRDRLDFDAIVRQGLAYLLLVGRLFVHVDGRMVRIGFQQVKSRELVVTEICRGIVIGLGEVIGGFCDGSLHNVSLARLDHKNRVVGGIILFSLYRFIGFLCLSAKSDGNLSRFVLGGRNRFVGNDGFGGGDIPGIDGADGFIV